MTLDRNCQARDCNKKATRDAKTVGGPWAYVCELHFNLTCHQQAGLSSIINQEELDRQTGGGDIES